MSLSQQRPYTPAVQTSVAQAAWFSWISSIARTLNLALRGKLNCVADLTLEAGATETVLIDERIGLYSAILLMPRTASAAAATGLWIETTTGTALIHHNLDAAVDRIFTVVIIA